MKNINHTRSSISDDIINILCSSANMRRAIPLILRLLMNYVNLSTNLASHFFDLVIGKILTSRLSLSKHLAHNLGNLLLLGKIGVFHNTLNASSRLLLLISKHLILCINLVFRILACSRRLNASNLFSSLMLQDRKSGSAGMPRPTSYAVFCLKKKLEATFWPAVDRTLRWGNVSRTERSWS